MDACADARAREQTAYFVRLFGQPVTSNVEGCNIRQNAKKVAFRCILLHRAASHQRIAGVEGIGEVARRADLTPIHCVDTKFWSVK